MGTVNQSNPFKITVFFFGFSILFGFWFFGSITWFEFDWIGHEHPNMNAHAHDIH